MTAVATAAPRVISVKRKKNKIRRGVHLHSPPLLRTHGRLFFMRIVAAFLVKPIK